MTVLTGFTAVLPLQKAVTTKLKNTSEFTSLVSGPYDDVDFAAKLPMVSYSQHNESGNHPDVSSFQQPGNEIIFALDVWSEMASDEECYVVLDILNKALCDTENGPQLVLDNHHLITFGYSLAFVQEEDNPNSLQSLRHMPVRYRALVQA